MGQIFEQVVRSRHARERRKGSARAGRPAPVPHGVHGTPTRAPTFRPRRAGYIRCGYWASSTTASVTSSCSTLSPAPTRRARPSSRRSSPQERSTTSAPGGAHSTTSASPWCSSSTATAVGGQRHRARSDPAHDVLRPRRAGPRRCPTAPGPRRPPSITVCDAARARCNEVPAGARRVASRRWTRSDLTSGCHRRRVSRSLRPGFASVRAVRAAATSMGGECHDCL